MWETVTATLLVLVILDIYYRLRSNTDEIYYLLLVTDVINKTLADKKIIDREVLKKIMREVINNTRTTNPKNHERLIRALSRKGVYLDIE